MTTINQAREAIYTAFLEAWTVETVPETVLETPVTFDNEGFKPPSEPWVRLTVRHTSSTQETLGPVGSRKFSRRGICFVQVFVPADSGTKEATELARKASLVFEGERISGTTLRFLDVVIRENGASGKWYGVSVEANFEYDETR